MAKQFFLGLELGQAQEFSALAIVDREEVHPNAHPSECRPELTLRHLKRFPLGTSYPDIITELHTLIKTQPLPGSYLALDKTGVGQTVINSVLERMTNVRFTFTVVTVTAGTRATAESDGLHLPKLDLIGTLQTLLQTRRLNIPRDLPDAQTLVQELETFRMKVTLNSSNDLELWREGPHDDLVYAVALPAWFAQRSLPSLMPE